MAKTFWVIVTGAQPTAFRARAPEDLLPTLKQLQRTQPDVTMKWFEGGRFWDSPEAATAAWEAKQRDDRSRCKQCRPGGSHVDPRAKYEISRDQKRARFKSRMIAGRATPPDRARQKDEDDRKRGGEGGAKPAWSKPAWPKPAGARPPRSDRPAFPDRQPDRKDQSGPRGGRGWDDRRGDAPGRPADRKRFDDRPQPPSGRPSGRPPGRPPGSRPGGGKPSFGRPTGTGPSSRDQGGRPTGSRPPSGRPRERPTTETPPGRPSGRRPPPGRPSSGRPGGSRVPGGKPPRGRR